MTNLKGVEHVDSIIKAHRVIQDIRVILSSLIEDLPLAGLTQQLTTFHLADRPE